MLDVFHRMKTPPFLLLTALLFWGWQSGFLIVGAVMGVILELSRFLLFRWNLDDTDFSRIWGFCWLLNGALALYVLTNNEAGGLNGMIHGNTAVAAANSTVITATRFLRWLPMTFFAFIVAQAFNVRESVPLTGISLVLRWRRRKGGEIFGDQYLNFSYPYFMVCVFSAGIHANNGSRSYFLGTAAMGLWALWTVRSHRYRLFTWAAALTAVAAVGFVGIIGINQAQRALQNFNAQWMSKFFGHRTDPLQTVTSMGRIGELKLSARIVIRLQPAKVGHAPAYLREASYRNFHPAKATWYAGGTPADFEGIQPEADNTTWNLLPGKKCAEAVNIACYLDGWSRDLDAPEGLLPLPSGCGLLENVPAFMVLKKNKNGALLAAGRGLVIFDAHYGSGATLDTPPDIGTTNRFDLSVPTNEIPAVTAAIAELDLPAVANDAEKRRAVAKFFLDKFTYTLWQGFDKKATADSTPLTKFLTTSRSGHCEYFASATVLLLRQLGIPARYAVGYYVHETRGSGYVVRDRDAHAWCLAWNKEKHCWEDFDTTPPSWVAIEEKRTYFGEWFTDVQSWLKFQYAKFRWRQANLQQYIFWTLIPVLVVLLYHIIFRRRGKLGTAKSKQRAVAEMVWPGSDSEFYRLEKRLAARGLPRLTGETLADWLERAVAEPSLQDLRQPLRELLRLHYRHRFDPRGLDATQREELKLKAIVVMEKISTMSS
jgi:hypothetical protein